MPNAVALINSRGIGAVAAIGQGTGGQIVKDFRAPNMEQGPNNPSFAHDRNPAQPLRSTPAQEPHENRLGLVIGRMAGGDVGQTVRPAEPFKKGIATLPRAGLQGGAPETVEIGALNMHGD